MTKKVTPEQFQEAVMNDINALKKGVADKYQRRVIDKMPVLTGQMVANTNVAIDKVDKKFTEGSTDPSRSSTKNSNTQILKKAKLKKYITITSAVPYSVRVEYEGWSNQAPNGMFRITAKELPVIVQELQRGDIKDYRD